MDDWIVNPGKTFADKAMAFRKSIGAEAHPVITRRDHPQQWRDWYAYYGFRRLIGSQELMREKDEKTVPALSPFDFDVGFNPVRISPEVPSNRDEGRKPSAQERAIHAAKFPYLNPHFEVPHHEEAA